MRIVVTPLQTHVLHPLFRFYRSVNKTMQHNKNNTPSVPIYRRYSFLKKISKYKTPAKFGERFVGFVDIFYKKV
jgi:hypothetical protein